MDSVLVILLLLIPLVGAIAIALYRSLNPAEARRFAIGITVLELIVGLLLFAGFDGAGGGFEAAVTIPWFTLPAAFGGAEPIQVGLDFAVDGISILLITLTVVLMPIVLISSYGHIHERVKEFLFWNLVMQTGMLGVFLATDVVTFYVFWELGLIPLYFIIGIWGGKRRRYATFKFFMYTVAGSLPMLLATVLLIHHAGTTDLRAILAPDSPFIAALHGSGVETLMFFAFLVAFAIKVPLVPFHTWLPDAHVEAPTGGSVILAGVLLKLGTYGILRYCVGLFPYAANEFAIPIMIVSVVGIIYGALLAYAQRDLKKLVAYSSVSHLGYVVLGIFALSTVGMAGGLLQMVNHGISTGALFLAVGVIYERRHTREMGEFGGLAKVMPFYAFALLVTTLSSIGLPGLNGFIGEFWVLFGAFAHTWWIGALAATGVVLGAVYMLGMIREVLFGDIRKEENLKLQDCSLREKWMFIPLMALMVWIGVFPGFFLSRVNPALDRLQQRAALAAAESKGTHGESGQLARGALELRLEQRRPEESSQPTSDGVTR